MKRLPLLLSLIIVIFVLAACSPEAIEQQTGLTVEEIEATANAVGGTLQAGGETAVAVGGTAVVEGSQTVEAVGETAVAAGETAVAEGGTVVAGELTPDAGTLEPGDDMGEPGIPQPIAGSIGEMNEHLASQVDGISAADVRFVEAEQVDWNDSSLGCPAPGMGYLTVITPGYRVVLEANGERYEYHTDMAGRFVLCVDGAPVGDIQEG